MPKGKGFFAGSRVVQGQPTHSIPRCGACGLHKKCNSPKMPVTGNGARGVLFVAEAPGEREDKEGTQLIGKAGERLRRVLRSLRFDLDKDGWKTNSITCRPPRNRKPTTAEVLHCSPNLNKAIRSLKPKVIIPMGAAAVAGVVGPVWKKDPGPMGRWAGWCIPCNELNAWVCPTWHPSYILREDDKVLDRQFKKHLKAAIEHDEHPWPTGPPTWAAAVQRVADPGKAARWLRKAASTRIGAVAIDYEANMLKPEGPDAKIVSCAVAWGRREPERCIAFPWHGDAIKAMGELLRSPVPKIASNIKFEDRWTRKAFGHRVRAWVWDTMLAAHVADNRPWITSVKFQAFVRLGVGVWNEKIEPFLKTKGTETVNRILEEINIEDLLLYNGLDALLEFYVATDQIRELGYPLPWPVK